MWTSGEDSCECEHLKSYTENQTYQSEYFGEVLVKNLLDPKPDQHFNLPAKMKKEYDQVMTKLASVLKESQNERKEKKRAQKEVKRLREENESSQE